MSLISIPRLPPNLDPTASSLPFFEGQTLGQASLFCATTSGFQPCDSTQSSYSSPKKRRRRYNSISMPSGRNLASGSGHFEKTAISEGLGQQEFDGLLPDRFGWPEWSMADLHSRSTPLAKQITNFGFLLCPCSGLAWGHVDGKSSFLASLTPQGLPARYSVCRLTHIGLTPGQGYCPLPEASSNPVTYDPRQPYAAEKQPSMQADTQAPQHSLVPVESDQDPSVSGNLMTSSFLSLANYNQQEASAIPLPGTESPASIGHSFTPDLWSDAPGDSQNILVTDLMAAPQNAWPKPNSSNRAVAGALSDLLPFASSAEAPSSPPNDYATVAAAELAAVGIETQLDSWYEPPLPSQPANFGILLPDQRGSKRGPFRDPKLREQTAQTRRTGSCIRCRMQRIRVSTHASK